MSPLLRQSAYESLTAMLAALDEFKAVLDQATPETPGTALPLALTVQPVAQA